MGNESFVEQRSWRSESLRRITTIILALSFIVVAMTGVQLDFSHGMGDGGKPPSIERSADGNSIGTGVSRVAPSRASFYPKVAHEWAGYLFIIAGLTHLALNLKPMRSHLGIKR